MHPTIQVEKADIQITSHQQANYHSLQLLQAQNPRPNLTEWVGLFGCRNPTVYFCSQRVCALARCPGGIPTLISLNLPLKLKGGVIGPFFFFTSVLFFTFPPLQSNSPRSICCIILLTLPAQQWEERSLCMQALRDSI